MTVIADHGGEKMHRLTENNDGLVQLCRHYHIRRLSLYGSVLKGYDRPESDVDLLVEFEPGQAPGLLGISEIEAKLSSLLGGEKWICALRMI